MRISDWSSDVCSSDLTTGLERSDAISTVPFAFRVGDRGMVALFRYGAAVIAGLSPVEEDDILRMIQPRVSGGHTPLEDEVATIRIGEANSEDAIPPGGPLQLRNRKSTRLNSSH